MRTVATLLQRWVGLTIATSRFVTGLSGAIISWDHELDEGLNPDITRAVAYSPKYGVYAVRFFRPGDDHGAGVGPAALDFDGQHGRYLDDRQPWVGIAADIFVQAQFPIHPGRILGLPWRNPVSVMGLVVAALSMTGVVICWRKRHARHTADRRRTAALLAAAE